jgi:hypothetical protein
MSIGEAGINFFKKNEVVGGQGLTRNRCGSNLVSGERRSGVRGEGDQSARRVPSKDNLVTRSDPDLKNQVNNRRARPQKQIVGLELPEIKG